MSKNFNQYNAGHKQPVNTSGKKKKPRRLNKKPRKKKRKKRCRDSWDDENDES